MNFSLLTGFFLGVIAIIFALQNTIAVSLTFLSWNFESSLALLIAAAILFGMLLSAVISIPSAISKSLKMYALKKQNKNLQNDVVEAKRMSDETINKLNAERANVSPAEEILP